MRLDDVAADLADADARAAAGDGAAAGAGYDAAMGRLPGERTADLRLARLERDKAWMTEGKLPEASADPQSLVADLQADPKADPQALREARAAYANSQYYMTWLMKLEGLPRDDWEPEIESSRQAFRLLAEQAERDGDAAGVERNREDLESAIRLARMEPGELQGLALPKQCQGCKSGNCNKPGNKPGKQPGNKPKDEKDSRKAGAGPPPDGSGS